MNLSVSLSKPIIPLLMEKMSWPPPGSMGPIFGEYLFIRFFQRDNEKKEGIYWPEAKMEELLMQMRYSVEPEARLISKSEFVTICIILVESQVLKHGVNLHFKL